MYCTIWIIIDSSNKDALSLIDANYSQTRTKVAGRRHIWWSIVVFKVYSSWDLYESPKLMVQMDNSGKEGESILAIEVKDF